MVRRTGVVTYLIIIHCVNDKYNRSNGEIMSVKIKCNLCEGEFSDKGIFSHLTFTHKINHETEYNKSPKKCVSCDGVLSWLQRYGKFCSSSCAATYNNLHKSPTAKKTGPPKKIKEPPPKFSTLYKCKCKHCGKVWRARNAVRFCEEHKDMYSHAGRAQYWFTFGISSYPELFDGQLIKQYGMRSKENPNGVTRDHRVSVQESILNGYDPHYIKHPLNCELMLFKDNASKHTKSSITYAELVRMVNEYDNNVMVHRVGNAPTPTDYESAVPL